VYQYTAYTVLGYRRVAKYTCMFGTLGDVCTVKDDVVSTVVKICARII